MSGQVPVWVPLAVGVLGFLAVVVGQWINVRREDKRWKREQEREDVRWKREARRELAKLEHENIIKWREERMRTYAQLLDAMDQAIRALGVMRKAMRYDEMRETFDNEFVPGRVRSFEIAQQVALISSGEFRDYLDSFHAASMLAMVPFPMVPSDSQASDEYRARYEKSFQHLRKYRDGMINVIRRELGANDSPVAAYRLLGLLDD